MKSYITAAILWLRGLRRSPRKYKRATDSVVYEWFWFLKVTAQLHPCPHFFKQSISVQYFRESRGPSAQQPVKWERLSNPQKYLKLIEWYIFYKVSELAIPYLICQKLSIFVDYSIRWVHYIPQFLDCWIKDKNSTCKPCPGCAVQLLRTEFTSLLKPSKSPRNKVSRNFRRQFPISW